MSTSQKAGVRARGGIRVVSTSREVMKKRWSPSRTSVTVMRITAQRRNQPYAE